MQNKKLKGVFLSTQNLEKLPLHERLNLMALGTLTYENADDGGFSDFWDLYDKKVGRPKSERKWARLSVAEKEAIMEFIPRYKANQPDKQYRKNPETFLNNRAWEDELINEKPKTTYNI